MKKSKIIGLVILTLVLGVLLVTILYVDDGQTIYEPNSVKVLGEGVSDQGITLKFRPPPESAYHCPGVTYSVERSVIRFSYVRSPINGTASVDIRAKQEKDGGLSVTFPFPNNKWEKGDTVELIDSNGKGRGKWTNLGIADE